MTDEQNPGQATPQPEGAAGAQLALQKIYTKDVSFEIPNAPQVFQEQGQAEVKLNLAQKVEPLGDDAEEIVLTITVTATDEDGDPLTYRWLRGEQVVATGETVRAEDLPRGSYILTVEVDDAALAPDPNDTAALAINVTDVNEPPTVALANTTTTSLTSGKSSSMELRASA